MSMDLEKREYYDVTQAGHPFADFLTPARAVGDGTYEVANALDADSASMAYYIVERLDASSYRVYMEDGEYDWPSHGILLPDGLTAATMADLWLSDTGGFSTSPGTLQQRVGQVSGPDKIMFRPQDMFEAVGVDAIIPDWSAAEAVVEDAARYINGKIYRSTAARSTGAALNAAEMAFWEPLQRTGVDAPISDNDVLLGNHTYTAELAAGNIAGIMLSTAGPAEIGDKTDILVTTQGGGGSVVTPISRTTLDGTPSGDAGQAANSDGAIFTPDVNMTPDVVSVYGFRPIGTANVQLAITLASNGTIVWISDNTEAVTNAAGLTTWTGFNNPGFVPGALLAGTQYEISVNNGGYRFVEPSAGVVANATITHPAANVTIPGVDFNAVETETVTGALNTLEVEVTTFTDLELGGQLQAVWHGAVEGWVVRDVNAGEAADPVTLDYFLCSSQVAGDMNGNGNTLILANDRQDTGWASGGNLHAYTGTPDMVEISAQVAANTNAADNNAERVSPKLELHKNGAVVAVSSSGYQRRQNSHNDSSNSITFVDPNPGANPVYELVAQRGTTVADAVPISFGSFSCIAWVK